MILTASTTSKKNEGQHACASSHLSFIVYWLLFILSPLPFCVCLSPSLCFTKLRLRTDKVTDKRLQSYACAAANWHHHRSGPLAIGWVDFCYLFSTTKVRKNQRRNNTFPRLFLRNLQLFLRRITVSPYHEPPIVLSLAVSILLEYIIIIIIIYSKINIIRISLRITLYGTVIRWYGVCTPLKKVEWFLL